VTEHDAHLVRETVYGSRKRLEWVLRHLTKDDDILEVGCGTGYMICRPLAKLGYRVQGIDLDRNSIQHGRELLAAEGLEPGILSARPLGSISPPVGVIIVSEVLEHLHDDEIDDLLGEARSRLAPGGRLLVTVPNGYGWFEMEHFLWWRLHLGQLLFRSGLCHLVEKTKTRYLGAAAIDAGPPSTLSSSPHVQRFTMSSITRRLETAGLEVVEARGSVAASGPFSNLLFGGVDGVLEANCRWGDRLGPLASGYFVAGCLK
jgi:2-polyprenyl-3-methyl-5-hydroxy-6-metoxy-1,4-benzoquinol methylase